MLSNVIIFSSIKILLEMKKNVLATKTKLIL